jgi:hypothetical protein
MVGPGGTKNSNVTVNVITFAKIMKALSQSDSRDDTTIQDSDDGDGDGNGDGWCFGTNEESLLKLWNTNTENSFLLEPELYVVEPPSHPSLLPESKRNTFRKLEQPFARTSIVKITVSHTLHPLQSSQTTNPMWLQTLALQADITSNVQSMEQVFGYFPHLTVCSKFWLLPEQQLSRTFCVRADDLNFHSTINTHVDVTQEELVIHMWYQLSGKGGKIKDSDCYVPVDLNLPNSGLIFSEHSQSPQTSIECVVHCESNHSSTLSPLIFSYTPTYRTSLQHAMADFCRGYGLIDASCYQAVHQITTCIRARSTDPKLPNIQVLPSPQDPFTFIHFEKVGGSSLRQ